MRWEFTGRILVTFFDFSGLDRLPFFFLSLFAVSTALGQDLVNGCDYLHTDARKTILGKIKNATKNRKQKRSALKFVHLKEHKIAKL